MKARNDHFKINRVNWDEATSIHLTGSDCYPIDDFRKGKCVLTSRYPKLFSVKATKAC